MSTGGGGGGVAANAKAEGESPKSEKKEVKHATAVRHRKAAKAAADTTKK